MDQVREKEQLLAALIDWTPEEVADVVGNQLERDMIERNDRIVAENQRWLKQNHLDDPVAFVAAGSYYQTLLAGSSPGTGQPSGIGTGSAANVPKPAMNWATKSANIDIPFKNLPPPKITQYDSPALRSIWVCTPPGQQFYPTLFEGRTTTPPQQSSSGATVHPPH